MIATGTSNPEKREISAFNLALDIARELRAEGKLSGWNSQAAERIIEEMIASALRNGGIRP